MRLILLFFVIGAVVVGTSFAVSLYASTVASGRALAQKYGKGGCMKPTGIQKFAYVALIVLMFGTAAGRLGGL